MSVLPPLLDLLCLLGRELQLLGEDVEHGRLALLEEGLVLLQRPQGHLGRLRGAQQLLQLVQVERNL